MTTASLDAHVQNEAMKERRARRISRKLESSPMLPAVAIERTTKVIRVFSTARGSMIICMGMGDTRCDLSLYHGQRVKRHQYSPTKIYLSRMFNMSDVSSRVLRHDPRGNAENGRESG